MCYLYSVFYTLFLSRDKNIWNNAHSLLFFFSAHWNRDRPPDLKSPPLTIENFQICPLIGCFEPRIPVNWTFQDAWRRRSSSFSWCASTHPSQACTPLQPRSETWMKTTSYWHTTKHTHSALVSLFMLFFFQFQTLVTRRESVSEWESERAREEDFVLWCFCTCFKREYRNKMSTNLS